jgi:hypothetical protein
MDEDRTIDAEAFEREMALNREAWKKLRDQVRRDYAGQYVAMAHGKIVGASPDFDAATVAAIKHAPVRNCFLVWPADEEPIFEPYDNF